MRITLLLCFLLISSICHAQIEQTEAPESDPIENEFRVLKHSFGFGIVGGGEMTNEVLPMPGLGYKYHIKNGAIRVMVGGVVNSEENNWGAFNSKTAANIYAGYQYHVMLGRFMPIMGIDAHAGIFDSTNPNDWEWQATDRTSGNIIGISPNLGLEFWVSKKLSVFLDTRFNLSYRDATVETERPVFDPWNGTIITYETSKTRTVGLKSHVSPLSSFMAVFHF